MKSLLLAGLLAGLFCLTGCPAKAQNCANPPVASVVPLNQFAAPGSTVTFTAQVGGGVGPYFIYWADLNGGFYGNGFQMTLNNVQPEDAGLYFAMVVDQQGCSSLTAGKLFVQNPGRGNGRRAAGIFYDPFTE